MNHDELFDALTNIDDCLVLEAHETPVSRHPRLGSLRRAAVLAAVVIATVAMSIVAVASVAESSGYLPGLPKKDFLWWGDDSYMWSNDDICYNGEIIDIPWNSRLVPVDYRAMYTAELAEVKITWDHGPIQLQLETMVLMPDGRVEYKTTTQHADNAILLKLDNKVGGEYGTILHVRYTISYPEADGWQQMRQGTKYLPHLLNIEIPVGTDTRFPDMKFNYDSRGEAATTDPTEETQLPVIVQKDPDVAIVITEPTN